MGNSEESKIELNSNESLYKELKELCDKVDKI